MLSKIPSLDVNLHNLDLFKNDSHGGTCLSLNQVSDSDYKFELDIADCNEKRFAVCRIAPPITAAPSKPPKFLCLDQTRSARRKRNADDGKLKSICNLYHV